MKLKDANYKSHWNVSVFCDQWKMMSDLNMSHEKVSDFVSIVWLHFSHKTEKFRFWKLLKYFNNLWQKIDMVSDLNMFNGKMSDFVSFSLFGFTLVIKLRNFDIKVYEDTLMFFDKKMMSDFYYVLSNNY